MADSQVRARVIEASDCDACLEAQSDAGIGGNEAGEARQQPAVGQGVKGGYTDSSGLSGVTV